MSNSLLPSIVVIVFAVTFAALIMHKPLPSDLTGRKKMQLMEPFLRLLCYYPNKILSYFHQYRLRIYWTRFILGSASSALQLYTEFASPANTSQVKDVLIDGVKVRVYIPVKRLNKGAIFYIHGGGYVLFSIDVFDSLTHHLSIESGMTVLSVEYRLAPEHPFPAAVVDCEAALFGLMNAYYKELDVDPSKIVIAGDSAGGSLATVLGRKFKDDARLAHPIKAQVLIYPLTQFVDFQMPSYQYAGAFTAGTSLLDADSIALWLLTYLDVNPAEAPYVLNNSHWHLANFRERIIDFLPFLDHGLLPFEKNDSFYRQIQFSDRVTVERTTLHPDLSRAIDGVFFDPDFSPLLSKPGALKGLPDTLILTCEFDVLRDEGYLYYRRLLSEGVATKWIHYDKGFHGMLNLFATIHLAQKAVLDIVAFINDTLNG